MTKVNILLGNQDTSAPDATGLDRGTYFLDNDGALFIRTDEPTVVSLGSGIEFQATSIEVARVVPAITITEGRG